MLIEKNVRNTRFFEIAIIKHCRLPTCTPRVPIFFIKAIVSKAIVWDFSNVDIVNFNC